MSTRVRLPAVLTTVGALLISTAAGLLLYKPPEVERVGESAIDVSGIIGRNTFQCVALVPRNESRHLAVLDAADPDPLLESRIDLIARGRVRDVEDVLLVDEDAARPSELAPIGDELAILIEDLNPAVRAVGDIKPALGIHRESMRRIEFAWAGSLLAPRLDELAVLGELDD